MGTFSKGIRISLRLVAGLYLLLNLCVATIPRCDHILSVLQHGLKQQLTEAPACHDHTMSRESVLRNGHLCECDLIKFVFVTLPSFDARKFILFRIQTSTLIEFDYILIPGSSRDGPEPPYPRWYLA